MKIVHSTNQITKLKTIVEIVIPLVNNRVTETPDQDVYAILHTQLSIIKENLENHATKNNNDSIYPDLIDIDELDMCDPVISRAWKKIHTQYQSDYVSKYNIH